MGQAKYQNDGDPRTSGPGFGCTVHPDALRLPYTWRGRRTVFVNSMSDLFHARVPLGFVRDVFAVMADTPQHTYQVLTKRSPAAEGRRRSWSGPQPVDRRLRRRRRHNARVDDLRAGARRSAVPVMRAAHRAARWPGPRRASMGHRRWRVGPGPPAARSCMGDRDPRHLRSRGGAVLLQAVGRTHAEGWRARELDGRLWDEMPQPERVSAA